MGMNFCAIIIAVGDTTHITRITGKKPALTVFITSSAVLAPLMIAMEARYCEQG
jgi:hypothetical protein